MNSTAWPNLQYALLKESIETVQPWTQIVSKMQAWRTAQTLSQT